MSRGVLSARIEQIYLNFEATQPVSSGGAKNVLTAEVFSELTAWAKVDSLWREELEQKHWEWGARAGRREQSQRAQLEEARGKRFVAEVEAWNLRKVAAPMSSDCAYDSPIYRPMMQTGSPGGATGRNDGSMLKIR